MPKIATRDTQTLDQIPKHARPEEFLDDEALAGLYERELGKLKKSDPKRSDLAHLARRHRTAAALTAELVQAEPEGEA